MIKMEIVSMSVFLRNLSDADKSVFHIFPLISSALSSLSPPSIINSLHTTLLVYPQPVGWLASYSFLLSLSSPALR